MTLPLGVIATVLLLLLVASRTGPGPLAARCGHLKGRAATLQIWGAVPPMIGGGEIVVGRVWALGAGLHFHVAPRSGGASVHIKVAQPRHWSIGADAVTIGDAKYVQVSGRTIERVAGRPAFQILLNA